jgi:signal transduction histidine kinase/DNA-binding response OmpR family regulator/serine phosphatase RsbU (regulator of sigma subunit)
MSPRAGLLENGGPVGADLAAVDWQQTPLGAVDAWPPALVSAVQLMLGSKFAMWMAWGPELTFFCNDAYRRDTLGAKYPWALGRPAAEVWAEIWPDIGPRIGSVLATGQATWDKDLLLFLERSGYREETYHTFSYSPLRDEDGAVAGMLCVVSEETTRVIEQRRMQTLRDLAAAASGSNSEGAVLCAAAAVLAGNDHCVPFALLYTFAEDGSPELAASSVVGDGSPAYAPDPSVWQVEKARAGIEQVIALRGEAAVGVPCGAWDEPPTHALVVPFQAQAEQSAPGCLVAGISPVRPLDDGYRGFLRLAAGQAAAQLATARAFEAERQRAEQLAELDRAKTQFFTNVSHELRTPLTLIIGPTEDALAEAVDAAGAVKDRARFEVVHRNAQRLLKLVNTLLDFSRLESGSGEPHLEPVDLCSLTQELAGAFAPAAERVGLELRIDCADVPDVVWVDQEMWAKVVLNLLSNAFKFTAVGSITVRLRTEPTRDLVVLEVQDTGVGIAEDAQPLLFERFHRVPGALGRTHEGSGIGLALVAELTALHGGEVGVDSSPGAGSTFTVRLPVDSRPGRPPVESSDSAPVTARPVGVAAAAEGFVAETARMLADAEAPPADFPADVPALADADRSPPAARILVVDDNADMRDYVSGLLRDAYDVRTAVDGEQALELAVLDPPDLVLTDVMMPRLDGFGLLAALRERPDTAAVPVIMLSARAGEESTVEGLEAGADDYLVKPFSARELRARVRANLELDRFRRVRAELERSGALLDQAQRLAGVGSWEIDLVAQAVEGSPEFLRQVQMTGEQLREGGLASILDRVHPDDQTGVRAAIAAAVAGQRLDHEHRMVLPDGQVRIFRAIGEVEHDADGTAVGLRGSNQDVTEQRRAEQAATAAVAAEEVARREHDIADELQRSLLPPGHVEPLHLDVASFYAPGVEGTQVGGDWYDVIDLGAGRTALVLGDVMGRGVRAAAAMGQLRAAVRAYARLDLPPSEVLGLVDPLVRDLGEEHIVTCVYAVYDPGGRRLALANAGHLPPLLHVPGEGVRTLSYGSGPPLGTGLLVLEDVEVELPVGAVLALYTDGLVESRHRDIDGGVTRLAALLHEELVAGGVSTVRDGAAGTSMLERVPQRIVARMLPTGADDDIALLLARVTERADLARSASWPLAADRRAVSGVRRELADRLSDWGVDEQLRDDVVLVASEVITNAVIHGRPPLTVHLRSDDGGVVLEVVDHASHLPRLMRPDADDEHGRGLQLVSLLGSRWGVRPAGTGKVVWVSFEARSR